MHKFDKISGVQPVRAALSTGYRVLHKLYVRENIYELAEMASLWGEYNYTSSLTFRQLTQDTIHKLPPKFRPSIKKWADIVSIIHKAQLNGLEITPATSKDCERLSQTRHHQGFVLDSDSYKIKSLIGSPQKGSSELWVLFDRIQDVQNLGTLLRSSYFYGVDGVILTDQFTAPLNATVSRASAGALEFMFPRIYQDSNNSICKFLEDFRYRSEGSVISTVSPYSRKASGLVDEDGPEASNPEINYDRGSICLMLGNESAGLDSMFIERSNSYLSIEPKKSPKYGLPSPYVDSLNVSVALGICLDQITAKLRP